MWAVHCVRGLPSTSNFGFKWSIAAVPARFIVIFFLLGVSGEECRAFAGEGSSRRLMVERLWWGWAGSSMPWTVSKWCSPAIYGNTCNRLTVSKWCSPVRQVRQGKG